MAEIKEDGGRARRASRFACGSCNVKLSEWPTADELKEYVIRNYSKLLSKLLSDDPGVFIYYHPDADIDACLALEGAPALVNAAGAPVVPGANAAVSAQAFKAFVHNVVVIVRPASVHQNDARMLVLHHLTGPELMYITQALQNGIWNGNCAAAGRFCGTVAVG
eukprot:TRINITY_DN26387_c0_g1_i1.p1 TRINITY_DN26387_c0_g1~~TRINITY_DN26387_c0_g1_i1.p1  ORF type:complete len:175 (+),score=44.08 TRINITY_DN26387_c0_g1_i1:35-526(+)